MLSITRKTASSMTDGWSAHLIIHSVWRLIKHGEVSLGQQTPKPHHDDIGFFTTYNLKAKEKFEILSDLILSSVKMQMLAAAFWHKTMLFLSFIVKASDCCPIHWGSPQLGRRREARTDFRNPTGINDACGTKVTWMWHLFSCMYNLSPVVVSSKVLNPNKACHPN